MANLGTVPQQVALNLLYSISETIGSGLVQKFVPRNPDGTIFNCTGLTGANLVINASIPANPTATFSQAMTVGTADATGVVLSLTEAQATALAAAMTGSSSPYSIVATDATPNTSIVGKGNLSLITSP